MDLVIMAGGMGSRFGGLKQIEPIDEFNNFIIDYSIYDAIKAGFDRVVFIIKEENYEIFRQTVGKRVEQRIKVAYVFQGGVAGFENREKPWGTGHAILCCKDAVKDNFVIINADDFYGYDAFDVASKYAKVLDKNSTNFAVVGYKIKNTLSEAGSVKRGVCKEKNGYLSEIVESVVERKFGKITATPLNGENAFVCEENDLVSMNMFVFTPKIFDYLEKEFDIFLNENKNDYAKCEFLMPEVVRKLIKNNLADVKILSTNAVWQGVTYKEDKPSVVSAIKELVDNGLYIKGLWK